MCQNAARALIPPHMSKVSIFHVLVQFELLDSILKQLIVLLEFHFIVHKQAMILKLPVHRTIELRYGGDAARVYNSHKR